MEKAPILQCTFLHIYLKTISHYTQLPFKNVVEWFFIQILTEKCAPLFCQFFCLVPTQNKYLFVEIMFFGFILVHVRLIQVSNQYIIIYTMKKHHFTWTPVFNFLIGLLYLSIYKLTITYNDTSYLIFSLYSKLC